MDMFSNIGSWFTGRVSSGARRAVAVSASNQIIFLFRRLFGRRWTGFFRGRAAALEPMMVAVLLRAYSRNCEMPGATQAAQAADLLAESSVADALAPHIDALTSGLTEALATANPTSGNGTTAQGA